MPVVTPASKYCQDMISGSDTAYFSIKSLRRGQLSATVHKKLISRLETLHYS